MQTSTSFRPLLIWVLFSFFITNILPATKTFAGAVGFTFAEATKWTGGTLPVVGDNITSKTNCIIDNNDLTYDIAFGIIKL